MKSLRKVFLAGMAALLPFAFFSCSSEDDDDTNLLLLATKDESLTVSITDSYDTAKTSATVQMKSSAATYGDSSTKVYIAYTTDGSEPTVSQVDKDTDLTKIKSSTTIEELKNYVDYGSADIYESELTFTETVTINAKAFYIANGKVNYGNLATKTITISKPAQQDVKDNDANAYGDLTFSIASSGNSLSTHYFGSSDNTFTYLDSTDNDKSYEHCYYQFQFSYKKNGAGNWFLYIRQLGRQAPIGNAKTGKKYLTSGTYTCDSASTGVFNGRKSQSVNDGTFTMLDNDENVFDENIAMSNNSFTLNISADKVDTTTGTTTKGNLTTAIENAK